MKKLRRSELAEDDFRELRFFCNDVFAKWITNHKALDSEQQARAAARQTCADEKSRLEQELEQQRARGNSLQKDIDALQRYLKERVDLLTRQRDQLEGALSVPLPPPMFPGDCSTEVWSDVDPLLYLAAKSTSDLQRMLDAQNACVHD